MRSPQVEAGQLNPAMQTRQFHTSLTGRKLRDFWDNRSIYFTSLNSTALKYGLFGVSIGTPSMWVVSLLSWVNSMGIPWWGAIAGVTLGLRLILLPFSINSTRQRVKLQEIQPELNKLMERARLSQSMGMAADAQNLRDEMLNIYKTAGVSPFSPMLGALVQIPVVISCFMGVRRLCETVPAVTTGGLSWFTNLAVSDPYFVLPVLAGLTTLFMTELGADGMNANGQVGMKYMMRGMSLFTVVIAAKLPAGLCLYWSINSILACLQTLAIDPNARATMKGWFSFSKQKAVVPPPPKAIPNKKREDVNKLVDEVKDSVFKHSL